MLNITATFFGDSSVLDTENMLRAQSAGVIEYTDYTSVQG